MESMLLLRLTLILVVFGAAIAFLADPSLFPGAPSGRVPVVIGLFLLGALNLLRLSRSWQVQRRAHMLDDVPKKPLGL